MANLKDIAQKLGVSVSTVSRGLNGGKEISREMTEKILKAADELGYTLQGRGGRATPDWNSAGIIVPEVASEYYARLVHKAKDFLAAKGYSLIMKLTDFKAAELLDAINTMPHPRQVPARRHGYRGKHVRSAHQRHAQKRPADHADHVEILSPAGI